MHKKITIKNIKIYKKIKITIENYKCYVLLTPSCKFANHYLNLFLLNNNALIYS